MIPLFKSDFSIGKSILTLDDPDGSDREAVSVFKLATEADLRQIVLVEDSLTGFLKAKKGAGDNDIQLIFGLRISCCDDAQKEIPKGGDLTEHKIIIFALNSTGCILLNKIYSWAFTEGHGRLDAQALSLLWDENHLRLVIPFYDSFIFNNLTSFKTCVMDFSFCSPTFFLEDHNLPFDALVREKVLTYTSTENYPTEEVHTIYYASKEDFSAYQTYKCICKRASFGRGSTLAKPNLDHCGSDEFSFESWHKKTRATAGF